MSIAEKAARLQLLLFDVDGVLTDGTLHVHHDGSESKAFWVRDGTAIVYAHRAGLVTGLLSARFSPSTTHRAAQLGITIVEQSSLNKLAVFERILAERGLRDDEVAFMGDDILDLPVLLRAGVSACPADAVPEVRERVDWVSPSPGGRGAVRDLVELVLRARGAWDPIVQGSVAGAHP
jgi:3-deoxy-D-manno-octulosonate 8-phosphate phosphatase (KDO 8-P phosphatase)